MAETGIISIAGYLPRLRIARKAIADANKWANPALVGLGKGYRTACGPDEDSLTMGVAAAKACLGARAMRPTRLRFASTTAPFLDRANAVVMCEALNLDAQTGCADHAGSLAAGMTALIDALWTDAVVLTVAADKRAALPASALEMTLGHGAAAVMTGSEGVIARCLTTHCTVDDFVDHYRAGGVDVDYVLEERWVRDEGHMKTVPCAIAAALDQAGLSAADIDHAVISGVGAASAAGIAKTCGLSHDSLVDPLHGRCGNTGNAHPMLMLALALEQAQAGARVLVANFAQGAQVILLETTDLLRGWQADNRLSDQLAAGLNDDNYIRFLSFGGQIQIDWGLRAERDNRTALSAFNRHRKTVTGFIGGKCTVCETRQFPKGRACVNPSCRSFDTLVDEPFQDKIGRVKSFTEDWLAISANPPLMYGNIAFDDGGVIMMELTDFEPGQIKVGQPVRFVFRIKDKDPKRNFRRYFWKAAPAQSEEDR